MDASVSQGSPIGLLLRLALQHYSADIEAALGEAGFGDVRPGAANVFPFVTPDGITVARLAELAHVRKQSMAQAVDQLERSGYVERRPNPRDHRSQLVFLTPRGASVPVVTHAAAGRVEQGWAELLGPAELAALRGGLLRLLTGLSDES
ncbi:MAG TPA: MarR family transcriptional regulator [Trebonia sp.]|jgi:DNA-binding MarR family transcriptional regulator